MILKKKNGRDFQKIAVSDSGYLYVPESPLTSPTMWIRPGLPGPYVTTKQATNIIEW